MSGAFYLAWRYLAHHKVKSAILVLSMTLIFFIPSGLQVLVDQSEAEMRARAEATPLLVGAKGSPLELVLNSLYFSEGTPEAIRYGEVARIADGGLARPIPLYVRFRAGDAPIVATTIDYFAFRALTVERGRQIARLGECVLGARAAERLGAGPGESVISSPETVLDLAGTYPLKMHVVGVLARKGTPDDDAVFVDVKTGWVIQGLGHGHEDLTQPEAAPRLLQRKEDGEVVGNASVVEYNEITPENTDAFHFHGDLADYPISAILAIPPDHRSSTLLQGRYLSPDERHQILDPTTVLDELLGTVVRIKSYVVTAFVLVGLATLATAALVFLLSLRLRCREIETLRKIGASRAHVAAVLTSEIVAVLVLSAVLAGALTALTAFFGAEAVRLFVR